MPEKKDGQGQRTNYDTLNQGMCSSEVNSAASFAVTQQNQIL